MSFYISFDDFYDSIWALIPQVWKEADPDNGRPLQIFVLTIAQQLYYYFYLKISCVEELFDPDKCPEEYLPFLASMVGWTLIGNDVESKRQQLRSAPLLYKIRGTKKGITLAEKLVGYSVFMTELYRDYLGNLVPKEQIFNNIPSTVSVKPWFKQNTIQTGGIVSQTFSDVFQSYLEGIGFLTTDGKVKIPNQYVDFPLSSSVSAVLPTYNFNSGEGSLARFSKTPRINVILSKDKELDASENVLAEAIDLFLSFKPFHLFVNNLQIMYSLSDYELVLKNGTTGLIDPESILSRDFSDISVNFPNEVETANYLLESSLNTSGVSIDVPSTSSIKGQLLFNFLTIPLVNTTITQDVTYLNKLDISLKGYAINHKTSNGKSLWHIGDFSDQNVIYFNTPIDDAFAYLAADGWHSWYDSTTGAVSLNSILTTTPSYVPYFSFRTYKINIKPTDLKSVFNLNLSSSTWPEYISANFNSSAGFFGDNIVINNTTYNTASNNPISLAGVRHFITNQILPVSRSVWNGQEEVKIYLNTPETIVQDITKNIFTISAVYQSEDSTLITLLDNIDYKFDPITSTFIFNTYSIIQKFIPLLSSLIDSSNPNNTISNINSIINSIVLYVVYAEMEENEQVYVAENPTRNDTISTNRKHNKFNRITFQDSSAFTAYLETASYIPLYKLNTDTNELEPDVINTRLFKESLPLLYTRNSLHKEQIGNNTVISYDNRDSRDTSKWKVYAGPAQSLYLGSEPITLGWWTNYFNVPVSSSDIASYSDIPVDSATQMILRKSVRWSKAQSTITYSDPNHFLATRSGNTERTSLYSRGSASVSSIPYIMNRRAVQGFKRDTALFSRSQNVNSFNVSVVDRSSNLSNYNYTRNNVDVTSDYMNPGVVPLANVKPETESIITPSKTIINNSIITYPTKKSQKISSEYAYPLDFTSENLYYMSSNSSILKPSLYANNIQINKNNSLQVTDFEDSLIFSLFGLYDLKQTYTVSSITDNIVVLNNNTLYVIWTDLDTGSFAGTGFYCLKSPKKVRPNVRVLVNGIEEVYGTGWTMASNPARVVILSPVAKNDIITILGQSQSSETNSIIPYYQYTDPTSKVLVTVPLTDINTRKKTDTFNITVKPVKYKNYTLTFSSIPAIFWYRDDNGAFCNVSVARQPSNISPKPVIFQELAYPNVQVAINGIQTKYLDDWIFIADPTVANDNLTTPYKIVLLTEITSKLQVEDIISISYTSVTP